MQSLSFQLFKFRVEVLPTFFLIVAVSALFELSYRGSIVHAVQWGVVLFVSIVVHELGHASVARRFGLRVGTIQLHMLGGHVTHERTRPSRQLAISLAGPGAGLALGFLTLGLSQLAPPSPLVSSLVRDLLYVNIGWSLVNLLPLYPLDGGMGLEAALGMRWSERQAVRVTATVGVALGIALVVLGYSQGDLFIPMLAGMAAYMNWQRLQQL